MTKEETPEILTEAAIVAMLRETWPDIGRLIVRFNEGRITIRMPRSPVTDGAETREFIARKLEALTGRPHRLYGYHNYEYDGPRLRLTYTPDPEQES